MLRRINLLNNYIQPKYVKYNFIKLHIDYSNESFKNILSFKPDELTDSNIVDNLKLDELLKKHNREYDFSYLKQESDKTINLIEKSFEESNKKYRDDILQDILKLTYFTNGFYYWNITNIIRKYNITSFDVFYALINNSIPFGVGKIIHNDDLMKYETIKKEFYDKAYKNENYINFDYWNGIAIKNSFPVDSSKDIFSLRIEKYNDRNNNIGYKKIIDLLIKNFDNKIDDGKFDFHEPETIVEKEIKLDSFCGFKPSSHVNFSPKSYYENDTKYHDFTVNQKNQNYWNHRNNFENKFSWMFQTVPMYENYIKKNHPESYNLINYFDEKMVVKGSIKNLSIVNMIIYGKTNINYKMIERLLNFIRYSKYSHNSYDCYQLDNFVLRYYPFGYSNSDKRYEITWREDNINSLKFARTDIEKLLIAKNLIQLMNEVEPQHLNFENYYQIAEWYKQNDLAIQTLNININNEISRIETENKLN